MNNQQNQEQPTKIDHEQPTKNHEQSTKIDHEQPTKIIKINHKIALVVIHITETRETHSSFKIRWVQLKIINLFYQSPENHL